MVRRSLRREQNPRSLVHRSTRMLSYNRVCPRVFGNQVVMSYNTIISPVRLTFREEDLQGWIFLQSYMRRRNVRVPSGAYMTKIRLLMLSANRRVYIHFVPFFTLIGFPERIRDRTLWGTRYLTTNVNIPLLYRNLHITHALPHLPYEIETSPRLWDRSFIHLGDPHYFQDIRRQLQQIKRGYRLIDLNLGPLNLNQDLIRLLQGLFGHSHTLVNPYHFQTIRLPGAWTQQHSHQWNWLGQHGMGPTGIAELMAAASMLKWLHIGQCRNLFNTIMTAMDGLQDVASAAYICYSVLCSNYYTSIIQKLPQPDLFSLLAELSYASQSQHNKISLFTAALHTNRGKTLLRRLQAQTHVVDNVHQRGIMFYIQRDLEEVMTGAILEDAPEEQSEGVISISDFEVPQTETDTGYEQSREQR